MAVDMFLKIDGIKGESVDKTHKEEIDVLAWSWGMTNHSDAHHGGGLGAGKVSIQDITVTKYLDAATTALGSACANGEHIKEVLLTVRKAGGTALEYLKMKMTEVLVTSYNTGASAGEDRLTEHVTLKFSKVHVAYQEQDAKGGKKGGAKEFGYDIAGNTKV